MSSPDETNKTDKTKNIFVEKDVLGQEKPQGSTTNSVPNPNRIFIVVGILVVAAIIYWLYTH